MKSELVSIVMATYNGEKYLRKQMDSILAQTHQHFELIVVDDASTDETLPILNKYAALDNRIHVFPAEKNLGFVDNFKRGIGLAKSEFIALSDQDDIFRKNKIELLLAALKDHQDCDLAVSDLSLIDEDGGEIAQSMWRYQKNRPQQGKPFRRLIYLNFVTGCAMMFRRRLLQNALPFPPNCLVHDWWLAVVAASTKGGGICLVDDQLTAYRQHGSNVIGVMASRNLKEYENIAQIKPSARGVPIVDKRRHNHNSHIGRLAGYLQRDLWTRDERLIIEKTKKMFEGYLADSYSSFIGRIIKLPQRLFCAASTKSLRRCVREVFSTIWPNK